MLSALENSFADASLLAFGLSVMALLADHLLVGCRLIGLLVTVPACNPASVPWQLRVLLLVVMAGMITPNVSLSARNALDVGSRNRVADTAGGDGRLHRNERARQTSHEQQVPAHSFNVDVKTGSVRPGRELGSPAGILDFLGLAAGEICLGLLLGIGANLILQGFRMAGHLIDQQTGLGLVASAGIDDGEDGSIMGELLFWLGNLLLLLLGGHLLLVSTLLETFRTFPPGCGSTPLEIIPVAGQLIQQSLSLALQLSAPVIAAHILVGLIVAHASSVAPQFQSVGTDTVLKIVIALGVLTLALTGTTERLIELIPGTQQTILQALHR